MILRTGPLQLIISILLLPIVYPFLLFALLINAFVRLIIQVGLLIRYGNNVFLLKDGSDGFFTFPMEGQTRNVIVLFTVPEGSLTPEKVANYYAKKIQPYRDDKGNRVNSKLEHILSTTCGYSCWRRDPNFNVRNQVEQLDSTITYTRNGIEDLFSRQYTNDFVDQSKPQWRLIIVPKYDNGSGTIKSVLFLYFHHSYFDGLCAITMWKKILCPGSELLVDPSKVRVPLFTNIIMHLITFIYFPFLFILIIIELTTLKTWIPNPVKSYPRRKFYALTQNPVASADLKKIKKWASTVDNGVSVSIANILSTATLRGIRATFPPERLVKELSFTEVVAMLPYPDESLRNRLACFNYPMPTSDKDSEIKLSEGIKLLKELKRTKLNTTKAMMGPEIVGSYYWEKSVGKFPRFMGPLFFTGAHSSIIISPLPWSKEKGAFTSDTCSIPVDLIEAFTPQLSDMGLTIACLTYADDVTFNGCADSTWMTKEELENLIGQIPREISKMVDIVEMRTDLGNICKIVEMI